MARSFMRPSSTQPTVGPSVPTTATGITFTNTSDGSISSSRWRIDQGGSLLADDCQSGKVNYQLSVDTPGVVSAQLTVSDSS